MLAVIADDITGAAEIAGIAHRHGLSCQLSIGMPSDFSTQDTDVLVIATDTRSLTAQEAYDHTAHITRQLLAMTEQPCLFRKTDSALRGNVEEELQAIIDNSGYTDALYMPANPSKGRIIKDGVYYIRTAEDIAANHTGTPLSETDFRFDPEFPATTSSVKERFPSLNCPDAISHDDIVTIINHWQTNAGTCVLAGAADLFTALINHLFDATPSALNAFKGLSSGSSKLIVRGSTQSKAIDLGMTVESMPLDVFYENAAPCTWAASIINRIKQTTNTQSLILTIGDKEVRTGKHAAVYLRQAMAEVTCAIIAANTPDELIIEGGATAFAILSQLPWRSFVITDEIAPGVVRMQPSPITQHPAPNTHITLKPGSYDWGKLFTF